MNSKGEGILSMNKQPYRTYMPVNQGIRWMEMRGRYESYVYVHAFSCEWILDDIYFSLSAIYTIPINPSTKASRSEGLFGFMKMYCTLTRVLQKPKQMRILAHIL